MRGIAFAAGTRDSNTGDGGNDRALDASALSALSLIVDGDTTPQALLDSLNAATMAQKLLSQDVLIAGLRAQIEEVHGSLLAAEGARTKESDELEAKCRIEIDVAHRRLELLQANLEEAKAEVAVLKELARRGFPVHPRTLAREVERARELGYAVTRPHTVIVCAAL